MSISPQSSKNVMKPAIFNVFSQAIALFTGLIYVALIGFIYIYVTDNVAFLYTEQATNILMVTITVLLTTGWLILYGIYRSIIKPSYEAFNIISQIIDGLAQNGEMDKNQIKYLQDFMQGSLAQLKKSSFMRNINLSKNTEDYIEQLKTLTDKNTELSQSKEKLSQLVSNLEQQSKLLQLEQAKTTAIINAIPNGLVASSKDGNIFLINEEATKLLHLKDDQILGKFLTQVLPINSESIAACVSSEDPCTSNTFTYESPDKKQKITLEHTVNGIMIDNKTVGTVNILRDTTQEQATMRAQKEFVSMASHQLRTPITSIKWNAELILSLDNMSTEIKDAVTDIYRENNRMEKLVNALLNLSRIDLGTIKFVTQSINLDQYIDTLLKTLESETTRKNISITKHIQVSQPIVNDPIYIDIILSNLLSNAVKYTPKEGSVCIKVVDTSENNMLHIEITDTGLGIPLSQQAQIFGRLFRADNAKNSETDGNGLGLYMVKQVIEAMNGNVWFESIENQGTTFFVELPLVIDNKNVI